MGNFDDTKSSLMTTISASAPTSPSGVDEDSRSLEYSTRDWIDARDLDSGLIHAPAQTYYKAENHQPRMRDKVYSADDLHGELLSRHHDGSVKPFRKRRGSLDVQSTNIPGVFYCPVDQTLAYLQQAEDTDGNWQITIEDGGSKVVTLATMASMGHSRVEIRGTYALANLMQELSLAEEQGRRVAAIHRDRLFENPLTRLCRLIKHQFWDGLRRRIDKETIGDMIDPKAERMGDGRLRVWVPFGDKIQQKYWLDAAAEKPELNLDVCILPEVIDAKFVKEINSKPGILTLDLEEFKDFHGKTQYRGRPFIVPGGRFNEMYGWDSYMIVLGLLLSENEIEVSRNMVYNFVYEIQHYGKILNANRSYYLMRTQPPFLTDMANRVYRKMVESGSKKLRKEAPDFLRRSYGAAIKEYYTVWMSAPRYDPETKLSAYRPDGLGVPPETEPGHFNTVLMPIAEQYGLPMEEFIERYNDGTIKSEVLDEYFRHDRAVRESGHDTTYRFESCCADLATIDLNSLLYKYEVDIARAIEDDFDGKFQIPAEFVVDGIPELSPDFVHTPKVWKHKARDRKRQVDKYLWNEEKGFYFDYHLRDKKQITYESATIFWALYAGMASRAQADKIMHLALPKLEELGGLVSGTQASVGDLRMDNPNRQWDYPYGWAPQQILAWIGMQRYGHDAVAARLAYRWLFMVTKSFVDFHGVVVEKYNVVDDHAPHRVDAEYGNQGADFKGVAKEGFGWVNASYLYGCNVLARHAKRSIGACVTYADFEAALKKGGKALDQLLEANQFIEPISDEEDPVPKQNEIPVSTPAMGLSRNPFDGIYSAQQTPAIEKKNPLHR